MATSVRSLVLRRTALLRPALGSSDGIVHRRILATQLLRQHVRLLSSLRTAPLSPSTSSPSSFTHRSLSTTTTESSRNLLAHMETTANNNPASATAQNAFYQALLRANLPDIVVERYNTGRYASNASCEAAVNRALERLGSAQVGGSGASIAAREMDAGRLSDMQAAAQSVAARHLGGSNAVGRPKSGAGEKGSPMYVVVEEAWGAVFLKWFTTAVKYSMIFYFSFVVLQIAVDMTGAFKGVRGGQPIQAEAKKQTVRFSDVHGCDEAKDELEEVVEFLKNPDKFTTLGGKLPKGVLLVGPPGTGKTMLARAVAGEAGVPFFFMSGSEFDEVYVGVGAKRVRELFQAARAKSPAIVFIDELDAIGGKRSERDHAYAKQTLNQLLVDLDGFAPNSGIVFLAATNFPQSLDPALTRPGRFDRQIVVPLPDVRGRIAILEHHLKSVSKAKEVDPTVIARGTSGFSGAQLENLINIAAIRASRQHKKEITMTDLDWAKDRTVMGASRQMVMPAKEKLMTAYHEGGHTLVSLFTTGATPFYKVTVLPRGMALGVTQHLQEMDKYSMSKLEYLAQLDVCMGGKVAEEIIYGSNNVTSGASSDIDTATNVAYQMVLELGFSEKLGNVNLSRNYQYLSAETKAMIDSEVRRLITESYVRATALLTSKRKELERLAHGLMEYETLDKLEVEKIIKGEDLVGKEKVDPKAGMVVPVSAAVAHPGDPVPVGPGGDRPGGFPPSPPGVEIGDVDGGGVVPRPGPQGGAVGRSGSERRRGW